MKDHDSECSLGRGDGWNITAGLLSSSSSRSRRSTQMQPPDVWNIAAGLLSLQFVEKPSIDFSLSAVGFDVTLLPGVMPALRLLIRDTIVNKLMVFPRQLEVPILDPEVCPCENAFVRPLSVGGRGWTNEWPQSFLLLLLWWLLQKPLHILDDEVRDSISSTTTKRFVCVSQLHRLVPFDNSINHPKCGRSIGRSL